MNYAKTDLAVARPVFVAIAVCQQFVRFLGSCVERDQVVDLVIHDKGHFFVAAVNGRAESIHKVLHAGASVIIGKPAYFQLL